MLKIFVPEQADHLSASDNNRQPQAGFTLLEILVVMIIIGILVTLGLGTFRSSQIKSQDAKRVGDLQQVHRALEAFYADKGYYPVDDEAGQIKVYYDDSGSTEDETFGWGNEFYDPAQESTVYMGNLPQDNNKGQQYYYQAYHRETSGSYSYVKHDDSGSDYEAEAFELYACLANEQNSKVVDGLTTDCSAPAADTVNCNYLIYSSNLIQTPTP